MSDTTTTTEPSAAPDLRAPCVAADGVVYLSAPGAFVAEPQESPDRPAIVNGQPAAYFWKDAIAPGEYHGWEQVPATGEVRAYTMRATPERIQAWHDHGEAMLAAGLKIPINKDHKSDAASSLGRVIGFRIGQGTGPDDVAGTLYNLCQFIGSDAPVIAARNEVSVGVHPRYTDTTGRHWGDAQIHLAVTQTPAAPVQGDYIQAASRAPAGAAASGDTTPHPAPAHPTPARKEHVMSDSAADTAVNMSAEHEAALRNLVPGLKDCPRDEMMSRLVQHHRTMAAVRENYAGGPAAIAHMSRADIEAKADQVIKDAMKAKDEEVPALKAQIRDRDQTIQTLSANAVKALDPDLAEMAMATAESAAERAVERGAITPEVRDRLMAAYGKNAKGEANPIMLSKLASNNRKVIPLAEMFAILAENKPVEIGETTGLQTLSARIPGDTQSDDEKRRGKAKKMLNKYLSGKEEE